MEEKWWSKFQTKNDSQKVKEEKPQEENVIIENEAIQEEDTFFKKEPSSKEIFEDAINFIQDLNVKIDKSVDEALGKDDIRKWINEIDETAKSAAETLVEKGNEFLNSKEVADAAQKAKEVMNNVVHEVKSWSNVEVSEEVAETPQSFEEESQIVVKEEVAETSEPQEAKSSIFEENNEIKKDIDALKQAVNDSINRKEVNDSIEFVKNKAEEANVTFTSYLNKPEVVKTKEYWNEKVEDSREWITTQMAKEDVADKVNYMKEKAEDAKKWVFKVYNSEEVQEGIEKAKVSINDVAKNTRKTFVKAVNDPRVQSGYVNAKETTIRTAKNLTQGVKSGVKEMQSNETLSHELGEWKNSAVAFTKQSAKLVGATANEIAHNEQLRELAAKGKEAVLSGAHSFLDALNTWASNKKNVQETSYIEYKKEENEEENKE